MNEAEKLINRLYGNIGFTCDNCGRETNGCSIVNGMKFCAKCYQETFGKDNQQNEIQQLKQQLEEKDEQIKKRVMVYEKQFIEQTDEIYSLKQQLAEKQNTIDEINKEFVQAIHDWKTLCAEKDKEIETMKKDSDKNIDYLVEFASLIENEKDCNRMLKALDRVKSGNKYIIDKANQSKTEFAMQELEKVKILIQNAINFERPNFVEVYDAINKQIKELKGEKDVKD